MQNGICASRRLSETQTYTIVILVYELRTISHGNIFMAKAGENADP